MRGPEVARWHVGRRHRWENLVVDVPVLLGRGVRLRRLSEADLSRIAEIRRTREVAHRWRGTNLEDELADDLADDDLAQFAIESAGEVVGMIQFSEEKDPDYRHASIDIFVDPSVHRRGIATDAISTLADYLLDERGHHRLVIDPAADNAAAIACYTKVGFKPVGVMRAYERQGDGSWGDGLLMDLLRVDRERR